MPLMVHVPRAQGDQQRLETGTDNSTRTSGGDKKCQKLPWVEVANLRMRSPHKTNFIHVANALTAAIRCAVACFCHAGTWPPVTALRECGAPLDRAAFSAPRAKRYRQWWGSGAALAKTSRSSRPSRASTRVGRRPPVPFRTHQPFGSHQHLKRHSTPAASSTSTYLPFAICPAASLGIRRRRPAVRPCASLPHADSELKCGALADPGRVISNSQQTETPSHTPLTPHSTTQHRFRAQDSRIPGFQASRLLGFHPIPSGPPARLQPSPRSPRRLVSPLCRAPHPHTQPWLHTYLTDSTSLLPRRNTSRSPDYAPRGNTPAAPKWKLAASHFTSEPAPPISGPVTPVRQAPGRWDVQPPSLAVPALDLTTSSPHLLQLDPRT